MENLWQEEVQAAVEANTAEVETATPSYPPPPRRRAGAAPFMPGLSLFGRNLQTNQGQDQGSSGQGSNQAASDQPDYQEMIAAAKKIVRAASEVGENLPFNDAIGIACQLQAQQGQQRQLPAQVIYPVANPRTTRPLEERLVSLEKTLPSYDGTTNVYDFIAKLEVKLAQHGVTGDMARLQLLQAKLTGNAFTAVRLNPQNCMNYQDAMRFLKETYAPSVAGVKAALVAMKFNAATETVREFNQRFDVVAGAAPTASIGQSDLKQFYLKALGKGDIKLMRDAIWSVDVENCTLATIQKSVVKKLDNFTILAGDSAISGANNLSAAYQGPTSAEDTSETGSTASAFTQLLRAAQGSNRNQPRAEVGEVRPAASLAGAGSAGAAGMRPQGKRACYVCGSTEHLANACPQRKKEMISKAVGYVLDHLDQEAASLPAQSSVPVGVVGAIMPMYAVQTLQECQNAANFDQQGSALVGFAGALAQYCFANPEDNRAAYYMQRVEALGDAALDEMMAKGDASLANKILVDRRQRTVGTQAGERGIAMDVWPGITEVLGALPAKTNVFEWLKESEKFCKAVVELAMEIAMDNGWKHNYAQMQEEIVRAQNQRKFGEYVADSRAKARLHAQEQGRIVSGKMAARAYQQPQFGEGEQADMQGYTLFSFEAARAKLETDFGAVEDMTSLAGPPTPHQLMQVVLKVGSRQIKVTAIRDTGSPDTIITKGLYSAVTTAQPTPTTKDFSGLGAEAQRFLGVMKPLTIRLTPKIQVEHAAYISPDKYCLLILGNDLFNKEVVETVSQHDGYGMICVRYQDIIDVLPFRMMTQKERQERERAYAEATRGSAITSIPAASAAPSTSYERAVELMIASGAANQAIQDHSAVPNGLHGVVMLEDANEVDTDDEVAYAAALAAHQPFLGL